MPQSGRGLRRRAGPKKGVAGDSGTPFSLPMTNAVLSCLVFWPLLWRPRRSVKNGPFHARKVGVAFQKGGVSGRDKRGKVPHPLPRPPGVLGWRFRSFSCRKIAVFADFCHSFFGCLVPRKWAWPSEGGVAGAPPPVGLLGGLCPVRFTGFWC